MHRNVSWLVLQLGWFAATALAVITPCFGASLETAADIVGRVEHSDNITLSDDAPQSELVSSILLNLGLVGRTAQFDTNLAYSFTSQDFKDNVQSDDQIVDGQADILWTPLPERFAWQLTHSVSDTVSNDRLADTPDNRQQRNIFSTGPDITARLSSSNLLTAQLRYVDVKVEDSQAADLVDSAGDGDSTRQIARLRYTRSLSAISNFLANAEYEKADANFDVSYNRLLVGYGARLRSGSYEILVGANKVKPDIGDSFTAGVYQVAFTHDFGGHNINLTLVKEATDTSVGLGTSSLRSDTFNPSDSNFDAFSIIKRQRADIAYRNFLICGACTISVSAFFDDQDYEEQMSEQVAGAQFGDQRRYTGTVGLIYALSRKIELLADANYEVITFLDDPNDLEYKTTEYMLGMNYRIGKNFFIGVEARQLKQDANVEGLDYDELRGGFTIRYVI